MIVFRYVGTGPEPLHKSTAKRFTRMHGASGSGVFFLREGNGNDNVGTHSPDHIHRQIIERTAIDEQRVAHPHGLESSGYGHSCPHGSGEPAMGQHRTA